MSNDIRVNTEVVRGFIVYSRIVGWLLVAVSLIVLLAWVSAVAPLQMFALPATSMRAGAALAGVLAGGALLLSHRWPWSSFLLSLLLTLLAGCELLEFASGAKVICLPDLGGLLPHWPNRPPGKMLELTAVAFTLLGLVGMAVASRQVIWLREACALAVIAITMASIAAFGLVLAGTAFNLPLRMPIVTASLLLLLTLAWMASVPSTGLTRIVVADSPGGAFARRLILPALLLPSLLTFLFEMVQAWLGVSEAQALSLAAVVTRGVVAAAILWVAYLLDRSERQRRTVLALRTDANTDGLTGLANRRAFDAGLAQALRENEDVALLILDLDHFKSFNDDFGHQAGDDALREAGRLLHAELRPGDLAARYGGEEFAVVLVRSDAERVAQVGRRILAAFHARQWPNRPVRVSIGAALAVSGEAPAGLISRADAALYRSKQEGRDRLTMAADAPAEAKAPPLGHA